MRYSDTVMDHFMNPRNVGEVDNPDGIGQIGNVNCGDIMRMTIKVDEQRIADIKFKTFRLRCGNCREFHGHGDGQRQIVG